MNTIPLAVLLVVMTGTQLSAQNRDCRKLRLLSVVLLGCEIVALALLVFVHGFTDTLTAWLALAMFALMNAGVVVADMIHPTGPELPEPSTGPSGLGSGNDN